MSTCAVEEGSDVSTPGFCACHWCSSSPDSPGDCENGVFVRVEDVCVCVLCVYVCCECECVCVCVLCVCVLVSVLQLCAINGFSELRFAY